jgi:hypothetical protein
LRHRLLLVGLPAALLLLGTSAWLIWSRTSAINPDNAAMVPHAVFDVDTEPRPGGEVVGKGVGVENGHAMFATPAGQQVPLCVADRKPKKSQSRGGTPHARAERD